MAETSAGLPGQLEVHSQEQNSRVELGSQQEHNQRDDDRGPHIELSISSDAGPDIELGISSDAFRLLPLGCPGPEVSPTTQQARQQNVFRIPAEGVSNPSPVREG